MTVKCPLAIPVGDRLSYVMVKRHCVWARVQTDVVEALGHGTVLLLVCTDQAWPVSNVGS